LIVSKISATDPDFFSDPEPEVMDPHPPLGLDFNLSIDHPKKFDSYESPDPKLRGKSILDPQQIISGPQH
jgi:hypothetical protein